MEKTKLNKLCDEKFSIIPINEDKTPKSSWKINQTKHFTKNDIKDVHSKEWGLITGYNDLEVIDIDLKVLPSLKEQNEFWDEYISFLRDNIDDFDLKFSIYKTKNKGYHILYKCKIITGNSKIAKLKGHTEAIIESRGKFGYVVLYDNNINDIPYSQIDYITEEDREILWSVSKTYNYIEEEIKVEKKIVKEYQEADVKSWDDYNEKTSIFDIIGEDFKIIRQLNNQYVIKRHGAKSFSSGYVYKDSGCMYLFSTATVYPSETLISPFAAYAHKNHFGDFTAAARDIYNKGFGSRIVKPLELKERTEINLDDLTFPIDVFPKTLQTFILECNDTLDNSVDYMGCALLWVTSLCVGNSIQIEVKQGWNEIATVWFALVGKAGIGKTPSLKQIISPLIKANNKQIKDYQKNYEKFKIYDSLSKKEQQEVEEVVEPTKSQFIANDITLESLVDLHQNNQNGVGIFRDELSGWIKDMNKYRNGSDLENWLGCWSGSPINQNRKTAGNAFVDKPLMSVLGGIQPSILNGFYTEENKDNGFVDRILLSYPELTVSYFNEKELSYDAINWYNESIIAFYEKVKTILEYNDDGDIEPKIAKWSPDAKKEWVRIFNRITDFQNSDAENEYMKSMYPKQKSYIPRFAMLIHVLDSFFSDGERNTLVISKESILKAEKLSNYFINMSKKIKVNSEEVKDMREIISDNKKLSSKEQFKLMYDQNPKINRVEAAEILGVSKRTVFNYLKEFAR